MVLWRKTVSSRWRLKAALARCRWTCTSSSHRQVRLGLTCAAQWRKSRVFRTVRLTPKLRALADRNAFLIRTGATAELLPLVSPDLPAVTQGNQDGVRWLRQEIPGDLDWPGMSFAVALASRGEQTAVAIVTSRESRNVVAEAVELATLNRAGGGRFARQRPRTGMGAILVAQRHRDRRLGAPADLVSLTLLPALRQPAGGDLSRPLRQPC